jgi:hypothetical protein
MGIIREPKEIDFIVVNEPLSEEEKRKVSEYIGKDKKNRERNKKRLTSATSTTRPPKDKA